MSSIGELIQTHVVALNVLKTGLRVDCLAYDIWESECHGREKLSALKAVDPLLPPDCPVQRYAQVLLEQMTDLLAQACSEELLTATHEYCDAVYEMLVEAINDDPASVLHSTGLGAGPEGATTHMAMAA